MSSSRSSSPRSRLSASEVSEPFDRFFASWRRDRLDGGALRASALAGDPRGLFSVGTWSVSGSRKAGIPRDRERAGALVLAGAQHFCLAALCAGVWHELGRVFAKDLAAAVSYYRRAARLGAIGGYVELGRCYWWGIGVDANRARADRYFDRAADLGYDDDDGGPEPFDRVHVAPGGRYSAEQQRLIERGAAAGDGRAQLLVAQWLVAGSGSRRGSADTRRAVELLTAAARHVGGAAYELGAWYERGHLVRRSSARAVVWYRRAVRLGSVAGRRALARCYTDGVGVVASPRAAARWLAEVARIDAEASREPGRGGRPPAV